MRGDLLEALFYAPEVKSPSYRARSVGFCALRPGAECATPVDRVLSPRARVLCARERGEAALELGGLRYSWAAAASRAL